MRNETGRFDEDDLNKWKKPKDEPDPLSKILLRSSENVQLGAIFGFFVAAVLGAGMGFLAYNF
ncbi:MAG TPA: hypothetical protein VFE62_17445, partial [Gemmataceae bacterium]|nr:hypothetical protein [Gemmataceae bacterium]